MDQAFILRKSKRSLFKFCFCHSRDLGKFIPNLCSSSVSGDSINYFTDMCISKQNNIMYKMNEAEHFTHI